MFKKIIFIFLLFIVMIPIFANASITSLVKVGGKYYDTLEEAIANASSTDTITLISDVNLDSTLDINKTININLNGNDITSKEKVFLVKGGVLNLSGKGTIKELEPNYGAIMVIGSNDQNNSDYSIVNVGKDVTLEGWSGIFITHEDSKSYGVVVNLDGKINAVDDTSGGEGIGVYVNGNIKHQNNSPVINIKDDAYIVSTGNGLYIAGYTTVNIGESYISGVESGIGIKAGKLNIDGATVIGTGEDKTPTSGYNNGIKASGTAIQIESNNGYAGNIELNIKTGNFKSKNSNVIYEYIGRGNNSLVKSIDVSGGSFISEANKDVFRLSSEMKSVHNSFITGGQFSSNPNEYLEVGYTSSLDNKLYKVTKSTMKSVSLDNADVNSKGSSFIKWIIIFIVFIISGVLVYLNRTKLLKILKTNI